MITWSLSRRERCTPFFVKKQDGRLRLIVDARRFNRRCVPPPKTPLGSVSALSDVELGEHDALVSILCRRSFWVSRRWRASAFRRTLIFPLSRTAPMGCTWSMYWCQKAHEDCLDRVARTVPRGLGIGPDERIRDRKPFPGWRPTRDEKSAEPPASEAGAQASCLNLVYAANNAVFGRVASDVARAYEALCAAVSGRRLPLHEKAGVIHSGEFLGVSIDGVGGLIGPFTKRVWRVRKVFEYLSRRPRVSETTFYLCWGTRLTCFYSIARC